MNLKDKNLSEPSNEIIFTISLDEEDKFDGIASTSPPIRTATAPGNMQLHNANDRIERPSFPVRSITDSESSRHSIAISICSPTMIQTSFFPASGLQKESPIKQLTKAIGNKVFSLRSNFGSSPVIRASLSNNKSHSSEFFENSPHSPRFSLNIPWPSSKPSRSSTFNGSEPLSEEQLLEIMVEQLARMLQHSNAEVEEVVGKDELHIDDTTADWINSSYRPSGAYRSFFPLSPIVSESSNIDTSKNKKALRLDDLVMIEKESLFNARKSLNSWEFNVLDYNNEELIEIISFAFASLRLLEEFSISGRKMLAFVDAVKKRYISTNSYHNFQHGCDVCCTTHHLFIEAQMQLIYTNLEVLALLVGALAHDVGHLGVNNNFLIQTRHPLAMAHNDQSPLENMHCVVLYEILGDSHVNIFSELTKEQWFDVRRIIIAVILGTDMAHHSEHISKAQLFAEVNGDEMLSFCLGHLNNVDCLADSKNRVTILELILHCADISSPFKPFEVCQKWGEMVAEEFCLQGDREKEEGLLVTPMFDRSKMNLCNMQLGFIEFVASPLVISIIGIFPSLHRMGEMMVKNFIAWCDRSKRELELSSSDPTALALDFSKLDSRIENFQEKMSFLDAIQTLPFRLKAKLSSVKLNLEFIELITASSGFPAAAASVPLTSGYTLWIEEDTTSGGINVKEGTEAAAAGKPEANSMKPKDCIKKIYLSKRFVFVFYSTLHGRVGKHQRSCGYNSAKPPSKFGCSYRFTYFISRYSLLFKTSSWFIPKFLDAVFWFH
eukprot:gene10973-14739_t